MAIDHFVAVVCMFMKRALITFSKAHIRNDLLDRAAVLFFGFYS
jgi:hypothetical protein